MIRIKIAFLLFFLIVIKGLHSQEFKNLDFKNQCDTSKTGLCFWDLSWGSNESVQPQKKGALYAILISGSNQQSVSFVEQSSNALITELLILKISASIKSERIVGKGAGLNLGMYDEDGNLIANKDMGGFYSIDWVKGSTNWKDIEISIIVPKRTAKIKVGMILYGQGKVWFSNFKIETNTLANRKPSPLAINYITAACDTIAKHSLYKQAIKIDDLRETALKIAGPAEAYSDCYLAVNYLLESLRPYGDNHSFFMTASESENWENEGSQVDEIQYPSFKLIENIGYLFVPPFHGGNPKQMLAYADSMQHAIAHLYKAQIIGWLVDLRENTGGNMEPMIAGLGPLFSDSKLGALINVNNEFDYWYYKDGKYYWDSEDGMTVSNPFKPATKLPIAVLTSNQTGSSGETVVLSFVGNAGTKSFGQPTWGLTTGNGNFSLKDGAQIFLSSTVMADRNNNRYKSSINPDMLIKDDPTTAIDEVLDAAIEWIRKTK